MFQKCSLFNLKNLSRKLYLIRGKEIKTFYSGNNKFLFVQINYSTKLIKVSN